MTCSVIRDLLPHFVEHECRSETKQWVLEHVDTCRDCRKILEELEKMSQEEDGLKAIDHSVMQMEEPSNVVWRKYFGKLLMKGILVFSIAYTILFFMIHLL